MARPTSKRGEPEGPATPSAPPARLPRWLPTAVFCAALAVVAVIAYSNSLEAPFLLDDVLEIRRQPALVPPVTFAKIAATNRPVVTATYALNQAIGGADVTSFHVLNLVAHIACGLVLFGFVRYTLLLPGMVEGIGAAAGPLAFVTSLLFLLHPIQTESVTYISQRAEIFLSLALLLSLWSAAAALRARNRAPYLIGLLAASAFGTLSKQMFFIAPALFALYDWCFLSRGRRAAMSRHAWLYLVWFIIALVSLLFSWQFEDTTQAGFGVQEIPPWRYLAWQAGVLVYYLRLLVWPDRLCFDCGYMAPWPVYDSFLGTSVVVPALVLIAISAAAWAAHRKYPVVTFGILGSAVILAPTSSIIPLTDVYVEHRLYLPIAFVSMVVVVAAFGAATRFAAATGRPPRVFLGAAALAAIVVCIVLARLTYARNFLYADSVRILKDSVAKAPKSIRLAYNLATEHNRRGQLEQALARYLDAIALQPDHEPSYNNLGNVYAKLGRYEEALAAWEMAGKLSKGTGLAYWNAARMLAFLRKVPEAIEAAKLAVELEPGNPKYRALLAALYRKVGRTEDARAIEKQAAPGQPGMGKSRDAGQDAHQSID
jgi:tetratricopeptide (TPR) repeat protein